MAHAARSYGSHDVVPVWPAIVECGPLRILRPLVLAGIVGLSTLVIGFVAVDRLTHTSFRAPPALTIAKAPSADPETTGTVVQTAEAPEAKPARAMGGFDTERLNALMRGEMPPAPTRKR